jgi:hypothetical protein
MVSTRETPICVPADRRRIMLRCEKSNKALMNGLRWTGQPWQQQLKFGHAAQSFR